MSDFRQPALLLPLQHHDQTHDSQHHRLQPRVFGENNRNVTDKRYVCEDTADDVFAHEEVLALGIQLLVGAGVVVALRKEFRFRTRTSQ